MDIVNWVFLAVMAGLIVGWLVTLYLDPEAFNSGAKR